MYLSATRKKKTAKVGRPKIENSVKRTIRFDDDVWVMLQAHSETTRLDVTAIINMLLRIQLQALGLQQAVVERLEAFRAENRKKQKSRADQKKIVNIGEARTDSTIGERDS